MKIRIVNLDFYMSHSIPGLDIQYSEFRGSSVNHVPIIRIYGSTEDGEKICLHVHGVFPYIYIPYDGQIGVDSFMYQIALGLDKAINISLGQASSNTQHVYKVCLISGIPFYGYHARQHQFLKIHFYNPLIVKKACTLLQNGNILGKIYQPHEAHIPYILQFMIDYNLHGMSFINVSDLKYRADDYTSGKYPENTVLPPSIRKMSVCKIEADTKTECILNRDEIIQGRLAVNPGIKALWEDEKQRRRNNGESSQMEQFLTQTRINVAPTSTHIAYKKILDEKLRLKPEISATSPELESSVYPAETPPDSNLLNASTIDVTSSQNTDDLDFDATITNESILDEGGRELYDLLRDLKEDNIENDSILSQVQKEDESDGENDVDLSLPLDGDMRTPCKIEEVPQDEFLNDSYFDTLGKLPQLDGGCDDLETEPRGTNKLNGKISVMRKRSSRETFKVKTSALFPKWKSKCGKIQRRNKGYFKSDKKGEINDAYQDMNEAEQLGIEKVIVDICRNITIKGRSKSEEGSCAYCPQKQQHPVILHANQNLLNSRIETSSSKECIGSEAGVLRFNERNGPHTVSGKVKRTKIKKYINTSNENSLNDNKNNRIKKTSINLNEPPRDMPLLNDSHLDDDNNSNINATNLNNTSSAECYLPLKQPNLNPEKGRYNLRRRKPKPPPNLSRIPDEKPKTKLKNKRTQTLNVKRGKSPVPLFNIILTKTRIADSYNMEVFPIKNCGKARVYYELGPNPKPKFRVVPAEQPYTFDLKNTRVKYPNTTWSSYYNPGYNPMKTDGGNSIVIISNQILEDNEKYCEIDIKKGKNVEVIKPKQTKKINRLTPNEERTINALNDLYDEIQPSPLDVREIFESLEIDGAPSSGSNSLSNYREDMKRNYDNLMQKIERSLNDFFNNLSPIRKNVSIPKEREKTQRNVSFNDVCAVRSYHSDNLFLFEDNEMKMIETPVLIEENIVEAPNSIECDDVDDGGSKLVSEPQISLPSIEISDNSNAKYSRQYLQRTSQISPKILISPGDLSTKNVLYKNVRLENKSRFKQRKHLRNNGSLQKNVRIENKSRFKQPKHFRNNGSVNSAQKSLIKRLRYLRRLLPIVSKNSEPINCKKDVDHRVVNCKSMMQELEQQLLNPPLQRCNSLNTEANYGTFNPDLNPKQSFDLTNYVADPDKSKDGVLLGSTTNRGRKRDIENVQYMSLDGPNDSSSDEDRPAKPPMKRKCVQPRKPQSESLKYSPLKVHYGSPTKSTDLQKQVNRSPISFTDQDEKDASKKFKRKLSFSQKSFNKTHFEEKLTCVYKSNKKPALKIVSIPKPTQDNREEITQNESTVSLITPYQKPPIHSQEPPLELGNTRSESVENRTDELSLSCIPPYQREIAKSSLSEDAVSEAETSIGGGQEQSGVLSLITPYQKPPDTTEFIKNYNTQFSDSSASLSDDIFSPNLPNSSEIFTFDETNGDGAPARLYDVLNNYIPEAGTSKLTSSSLTPKSEELGITSSIETIVGSENQSSENDVLTPYQREVVPSSIFEFANQSIRKGPACIIPKIRPPPRKLIEASLRDYNIPDVRHREAFYSNVEDVRGPVEIGVKVLRILSDKIVDLPEFDSSFKGIDYYRRDCLEQMYPEDKITIKDINSYKKSFCKVANCVIRPAELPPTRGDVKIWLKNKLDKAQSVKIIETKKRIVIPCSPGNDRDDNSDDSLTISPCTPLDVKRDNSCQITGVTLDKFAISNDNLQNAKAVSEYLNLTVICMELIIETRNNYNPDPSHDTIKGIVYRIFNDVPEDDPARKRSVRGCFLLDNVNVSPIKEKFSILDGIITEDDETIKIVKSEVEVLTRFVEFFIESDPDILIGYEIEMLSWGYLIERGYILNLNLISLLSRVAISTKNKPEDDHVDLTIPGRIILDFWRLLRHEIALQSYTFENIVYHILHERVPLYSFKTLTNWWNYSSGLYRNRVLRYYHYRIDSILRIIEQLDLIGRTSELAKLFGIQFYEVLSRGSQFRVESMMLRLAKPLDYIAVSPNVQQRAKMRAAEFVPLIMEPESKFYVDPVIVLDFQSLYPSMIIAYNYCFSTCLGRIEHLGGNFPFEFGATHLKIPRKYVKNLSRKDLINISPCGVGYVKKSVREGILPKMLQEILDTRLMVKKSLKKNSGNKTLGRVLDARQLGLKLIANVTYGYTAANFSGRMPCIEVGDSVVSKGRETLQRAINLVEKTVEWGARVVYGDTDSLFVLIPGRSREEAFRIGAKIAEAVTDDNPSPVRLKLEKIFHPCILQTKKRYVGYMFESPDQIEPEYCAKGIETVRRDGCPAVSKMLEKCLKILFDTRDVSLVRQYVVRQFSKILSGRISIQDLTFAKEYRGASDYRPGACVPALELARKWSAVDKRSEPRRKERVPYVIINGPPGLPLIKLVRSPRELIADPSLRPNALYYITKVIIPPINRCFLLIGADINNWFNDMPRKLHTSYQHNSSPVKGKKSTISQYFSTRNCAICAKQSKDGLCDSCLLKSQGTSAILHEKIRVLEQNHFCVKKICELCCSTSDRVMCISLDCPVYYKRIQINKEIQQTPFFRELIAMLPPLDF